MADDMMDLRALVEKTADADPLREMIGFAAGKLMEMEAGAAWGERGPLRTVQRDGHRDRGRETRAGTVELRIPKLGKGSCFPGLPGLPGAAPHGRERARERHRSERAGERGRR